VRPFCRTLEKMLDRGGGKLLDRNHKRVAVVATRAVNIDRPRCASQGVGTGSDF
jgi:hypothetical protein